MKPSSEAPPTPVANLPEDVWAQMFAVDDEVAAACFALNRSMHALAERSLLSREVLPPGLRRLLTTKRGFTLAALSSAMQLPRNQMYDELFASIQGMEGEFEDDYEPVSTAFAQRVLAFFTDKGGVESYQKRLIGKRVEHECLEKAMAVLQLQSIVPRDEYGEVYSLPLAAWNDQTSLEDKLVYLAHYHYLDECTEGEFEREVLRLAEEERRIYLQVRFSRFCTPEISWYDWAEWHILSDQSSSRFGLPASLPWLQDSGFTTTEEAILGALQAADPGEAAKYQHKMLKRAACSTRVHAFETARANAPVLRSAAELIEFTHRIGRQKLLGDYFETTMASSTELDVVVATVTRLEKLALWRQSLLQKYGRKDVPIYGQEGVPIENLRDVLDTWIRGLSDRHTTDDALKSMEARIKVCVDAYIRPRLGRQCTRMLPNGSRCPNDYPKRHKLRICARCLWILF
jgi:hypothetical protein|tara:strand:+ start:284 stop:1660 length:1377 start_codon:yes stop_codon:yes gene_type:complete